tara:strand:+ start:120 stop:1319 length:1200 start_codon:yes stop_codon:yes gene_type:complete
MSSSTTVENKYDDTWIKNALKDAKNKYKSNQSTDKQQGKQIGNIKDVNKQQGKQIGNIKDVNKKQADQIKNKVGLGAFNTYKDTQEKQYGKLEDQISTLGTKDISIGDGLTLKDYLTDTKKNFNEKSKATSDALTNLEEALSGGTFKIGEGENAQTIGDIQQQLADAEGNLSSLTDQFSGLGEYANIGELVDSIKEDYEGQLTDLDDSFQTTLYGDEEDGTEGLVNTLTSDITNLFQAGDSELQKGLDFTSEQIADLQLNLGDYKKEAAQDLTDVQLALEKQLGDQYGELTGGLSDLQSATDQQILDVYQTGEEAIQGLDEKFAGQLQDQATSLEDQIQASEEATDTKLGQLGSLMNYRMIGDSAGGLKMRRSKAYSSGAVNMGTGQLSRSMKLKTLNL